MLKIEISSMTGIETVVALSGWIRGEHLPELERVLAQARDKSRRICLDLHDVSLVDPEAVEFLAAYAARFVILRACPSYLQRWLKAVGRLAARNHEAS